MIFPIAVHHLDILKYLIFNSNKLNSRAENLLLYRLVFQYYVMAVIHQSFIHITGKMKDFQYFSITMILILTHLRISSRDRMGIQKYTRHFKRSYARKLHDKSINLFVPVIPSFLIGSRIRTSTLKVEKLRGIDRAVVVVVHRMSRTSTGEEKTNEIVHTVIAIG